MISAVRILCCVLILGAVAAVGVDINRLSHETEAELLQARHCDELLRLTARDNAYICRLQRRERRTVETLVRNQGYHLDGESDWNAISTLNLYNLAWE